MISDAGREESVFDRDDRYVPRIERRACSDEYQTDHNG
jgi:hypothetical protein